jgi:GT2 family glycosyltransferase
VPAELAVVVPVLGQAHLTAALLSDVHRERDLVDVIIVDNGGDYVPAGDERVLSPGRNTGWLGGCNLGLQEAAAHHYRAVVLLNNDTRLSPGFFGGLAQGLAETDAGLIGPAYDDVWPAQHVEHQGPAADYVPRPVHRTVSFLDGTCILVPVEIYRKIGPLDADHFGAYGWGADFDYALRVRELGADVFVTELAYLTHIRQATARHLHRTWELEAQQEMRRGMAAKWGPQWSSLVGIA